MAEGFVYALRSERCPLVRIGRTDVAPYRRMAQINAQAPYSAFAPWALIDCRRVVDSVATESALHQQFASVRSDVTPGARELFAMTVGEARNALEALPDEVLVGGAPVSRLRLQPDFMAYLQALFRASGLENFFSLQEAWTFSLFPSTNGGRFFTLNIDRHEVAYSAPLNVAQNWHAVIVDRMILQFSDAVEWIERRNGLVEETDYLSGKGRLVTVCFAASFDDAIPFFAQPGVRRALLAYWYDSLLDMQDRGARSLFARFHNHNAVSAIFELLKRKSF